ncbi:MAG: PQQ-binding-like beta-propeller repeat protein, partial [Deltaproteobacteria bacterium]
MPEGASGSKRTLFPQRSYFMVAKRYVLILLVSLAAALNVNRQGGSGAERPDGSALFERNCVMCHYSGTRFASRAPDIKSLRKLTREVILQTLDSGAMKVQAAGLSPSEKVAVAQYLGKVSVKGEKPPAATCQADPPPRAKSPRWDGWGVTPANTRFQPEKAARLNQKDVQSFALKWAFGFPGAWATYGQPTAFGGRIFEGSEDGTVYSLDMRTGCVYWTFKAAVTVKTAVAIDAKDRLALFGDTGGNVYAVNLADGKLLWQTHVDPHPAARITGSPLLVGGNLYVPVSSGEEGAAMDPKYPCCTFRGSLVNLDARTGAVLWKSYTIHEEPKLNGRTTSAGTALWGPSGAAIWSSPAADRKRQLIYVATGNAYSDPDSPSSDAIMAFSMKDGKMVWSRQLTPNDRWNSSCIAPDKANCPEQAGNDFDFGSAPILTTSPGGRDVLIAAQKSGMVYALDPDRKGETIWQQRIAQGGPLGGIEWGGAADHGVVYFPRSDWSDSRPEAGGGLFALRILDGQTKWSVLPAPPDCLSQPGCSAAQMAPLTVLPGVVFSGSLDGHLRAFDTKDGRLLWDYNTAQTFKTVNGADARGGSIVATGPLVVDGMLFINSGYTNAMAGNVLLA